MSLPRAAIKDRPAFAPSFILTGTVAWGVHANAATHVSCIVLVPLPNNSSPLDANNGGSPHVDGRQSTVPFDC
jgi:hypothetical protein